ncbi:hypothetical protein DW779_07875 [Clostridium sp. AM30-24]|nr:hypothetical protein DW779_07875 [Clostridium sp. AM30-24]
MTRFDDMKYKMSGKGDCNGRILQMADIRFSRQRPVTMMIRRRIYAQKCLNHPIKTIGKSVPGLTRIKKSWIIIRRTLLGACRNFLNRRFRKRFRTMQQRPQSLPV